jgi:Carboxypeptidase regulatory-like domain
MKHFLGGLVAIVVAIGLGSQRSMAQTSSATISGHVVDQTQGIVTNAQVRLVNEQTGVVVSTSVLANGDFIFLDVQPGTHSLLSLRGPYRPRHLAARLRLPQCPGD